MMDHESAQRSGGARARCVLWAPGEPPEALLDAMRRRGVEPRVTHDAFRTMAEVVAGGSMEVTGSILVLVEPAELRGKRAMLTSCRRYAAGLRVWVFQAAAPVQLRPLELTQLVPEPPDEPEHTFGHEPSVGPASPPSLRLVEEDDDASGPGSPDPNPADSLAGASGYSAAGALVYRSSGDTDNASSARPSGLLTDEELAMLLADDPTDRKKR